MTEADAAQPEDGEVRAGDIGFAEFVALMALVVSVVALGIDVMLPALPLIGESLGVADENDRQLVISVFVLGLALSPIPFGVAADAYGRKPVVFFGLGIFVFGAAISAFAGDFTTLLIGRFLQGLGAAAPRTIAMSIVRDRTAGREMARLMSFIMATFILVPAAAPSLGLAIQHVAGWRANFLVLLALAAAILLWMGLRLPETLPPERRRVAHWREIREAIVLVLTNRRSLGCSVATGFLFGAFLAYLSSSQQLIGEAYGWGEYFALVFSGLALCVGGAAFVNARLVMRLGMRRLSRIALVTMIVAAALYLAVNQLGEPPFWVFALWGAVSFFGFGLTVGNLNALAMEPLGAVAGIGAALIATIMNLLAAPLAILVARAYDGDATPIVFGFLTFSCASLLTIRWADQGEEPRHETRP